MTSTTNETPRAIHVLIADGSVMPGLGGRAGSHARLVFDPEARAVTVWAGVWPESYEVITQQRVAAIALPHDASGQSVRDILEANREVVTALLDAYRGERVDTNGPWRGRWSDDADELLRRLTFEMDSVERVVDTAPRASQA